jgi:hypothetical protein
MNHVFTDLITVDKDTYPGKEVYISCTELCDWLMSQAKSLVKEGLGLIEGADDKFLNDNDVSTYINIGSKYETIIDIGKLIADNALNKVGSAMVGTVNTIEDMGFTDE